MCPHVATMEDWQGDDRLNDTDRSILVLLDKEQETTGSLADKIGKNPQYIRERLRWLREWGYVRYEHQPTGLHTVTEPEE